MTSTIAFGRLTEPDDNILVDVNWPCSVALTGFPDRIHPFLRTVAGNNRFCNTLLRNWSFQTHHNVHITMSGWEWAAGYRAKSDEPPNFGSLRDLLLSIIFKKIIYIYIMISLRVCVKYSQYMARHFVGYIAITENALFKFSLWSLFTRIFMLYSQFSVFIVIYLYHMFIIIIIIKYKVFNY